MVPSGTGTIEGVIKDDAGRPLRRALVTITGDMRVTLKLLDERGFHNGMVYLRYRAIRT
jgi:hypothetical protein